MNRTLISLLGAAALPLGACTTSDSGTYGAVGTGAVIGAAGGAGVAGVAGGDVLTGALVGAAVGGLAGAVWADRNNDGRADGYIHNGQYYAGQPGSYQSASQRCGPSVAGSAATGAGVGAAAGAGVGVLSGGVGVLEGAAVGAVVGGLAGAIWADSNNDGCADGYVREGRYYSGSPVIQPTDNLAYTGERG